MNLAVEKIYCQFIACFQLQVKLIDCPGMVLSTASEDQGAELKNAVKVETIADPVPLVGEVLKRCEISYFMHKYQVIKILLKYLIDAHN